MCWRHVTRRSRNGLYRWCRPCGSAQCAAYSYLQLAYLLFGLICIVWVHLTTKGRLWIHILGVRARDIKFTMWGLVWVDR